MEESNEKSNIAFTDLYEMYIKIKVEIKCQYEKGDRGRQSYFEPMLTSIEEKFKNVKKDSELYAKLITLKASLYYEHAKIMIAIQDPNEPLCLQLLNDSLNLLEPYKRHPHVTYLYLRILNILAYTLSKSAHIENSLKLLEDAELLYESLTNKVDILVFNTDELFQNVHIYKGNSEIKFEKLITNNLQIQAWIYNKMNFSKKFLKYHHIVLKRQLETEDGNALIWFYKCARLGVYFFSNNKFVEGSHHLAAASSVLREYERELLKHRNDPQVIIEWRNVKKYYADLGKYWSKYGLFLFSASRHLAVGHVRSESSMNDVLIQSFPDVPSSGPAREWFNIRKNSMFFPSPKKNTPESANTSKQKDQSYKNLVGELNEQKSATDLTFQPKNEEKPSQSSLASSIQQEIEKMNEEVDNNEAEEINEVTKMIIEALDDRKKEVEEEEKSNGNQKFVASNPQDSKIPVASKQNSGDQNKITQQTEPTQAAQINETNASQLQQNEAAALPQKQSEPKSDTTINSKQQESSESLKNLKDPNTRDSKSSNYSDAQSSSSRYDDDAFYEFKFPSLNLSQFVKVPTDLIDTTEGARSFFLYTQEWINRALSFYTMQEHPNEYIQLILDLNEIYRYLSTYEIELESQYDIQRRRVEILENLCSMLKESRPHEYLFVSIELLQELMQAQIELLILNIRKLTHVQSSGSMLLKDLCQEHNDVTRKMEALVEIQRRLGRRDQRMSLVDMQLFG